MKTHPCLPLLLIFIGSVVVSTDLLGIPPQDIKYFTSDVIKCKDGSKKFSKAQLNDDFCDCPDGTDEPGTPACPGAKFYCQNAGHAPLLLFSSRVNDGICDCCDGSDEYDGRVNCSNTCWEAGKVARDKLRKKIATYQEGVTVRNHEIEQAKRAIDKDEAELSKLKSEEKILKKLVEQLKEKKEQIEKAEERERLEKEEEEKKRRESEGKSDEEPATTAEKENEDTIDKIGNLDDPPVQQVQPATTAEKDNEGTIDIIRNLDDPPVQQHVLDEEDKNNDEKDNLAEPEIGHDGQSESLSNEAVEQDEGESDNTKELSKEELGRLVASRWTGEDAGQKSKDIDDAKLEEHETSQSAEGSTHEEDNEGYGSETDEDTHKYEDSKYDEDAMDDDVEEEYSEENHDDSSAPYNPDSYDQVDSSDETESSPSWLDKIQRTVRNILQSVNPFRTPVNISEASHVRKEYDDSSAKLSKMQSRISGLTEKLKNDFGTEKEFYSFYGRCFENKENKYVYKVCPFKQASQVEGHSTTQLGYWEKFDDSYKLMVFSNGEKCWNGPDRSLKVKLRCGLKNELTDVDEPSRCEYVALLATPALCLEERLKELQHKLELLNSEQPPRHDEL